ncbi:MAG: hypothetical protein HYX32_09545 [Actinobacteria bacterium]|nr:hypothetical protein [Actinomycetota bacterium]
MPLADRVLAIDAALDDAGVPHAFGGALALAYHTAEPRGTRDIDVNVFVDTHRAEGVFRAMPDGVEWGELEVRRVERDAQVRLLWDETPVDLFFSNHPFHDRASERVRRVPFPGGEIPILGPDELAVFKAFFNRTKDWADLEAMIEVHSIDGPSVLGWLVDLLGPDDDRIPRLRDLLHAPRPEPPRFDPRTR